MDVTLRQLGVFVAVTDHEGFGTGAASLGMSQSSVSHALAALERTVRGELVHRDIPVRPTPLGETLLPHARAALAAARGLTAAADAHHGTATASTIGLAVPPTVARGLLPRLLRLWHQHLPDTEVRIYEGLDQELARWLADGTVDAAVLVDPDPHPEGGLLLATDTFHAVLRADHPLAHEESITLADLLEDPLLASTSGCEPQITRLHAQAGLPYRPAQRIRELTTLLAMVEAGLGVAVIPTLAASMLPATLILTPLQPRLERRLVLTGPSNRPWHPHVTAIRDLTAHRTDPASAPTDHPTRT
ncbi:LysR family transcriptional regulator [Streptomyces uncialis]|uniref:LysR family transcriptional regulator n=1 Tax=Streptomyces uncialis TaxID=1048205 RepID=UPI003864FBAB|nr:LysR family transcriptional regulator [Streptomyces uncialis]